MSYWVVETEYQLETARVYLRVAILSHGDYLLYHMLLRSSDKGIDIIRELKRSLVTSRGWWTNKLMKVVPFLTPVVYNATMCPVPIETISQDLPCIVDIQTECRCQVLTKALHNPGELPVGCDLLASYRRFTAVNEAPGTTRARDVLLVRLEFHKTILLVFTLLSILLSIISGIVAGVYRRSLDTGLGVFGAVIGVVGVVMGILTYYLK